MGTNFSYDAFIPGKSNYAYERSFIGFSANYGSDVYLTNYVLTKTNIGGPGQSTIPLSQKVGDAYIYNNNWNMFYANNPTTLQYLSFPTNWGSALIPPGSFAGTPATIFSSPTLFAPVNDSNDYITHFQAKTNSNNTKVFISCFNGNYIPSVIETGFCSTDLDCSCGLKCNNSFCVPIIILNTARCINSSYYCDRLSQNCIIKQCDNKGNCTSESNCNADCNLNNFTCFNASTINFCNNANSTYCNYAVGTCFYNGTTSGTSPTTSDSTTTSSSTSTTISGSTITSSSSSGSSSSGSSSSTDTSDSSSSITTPSDSISTSSNPNGPKLLFLVTVGIGLGLG